MYASSERRILKDLTTKTFQVSKNSNNFSSNHKFDKRTITVIKHLKQTTTVINQKQYLL